MHHTTIINCVKELGNTLRNTPQKDEIPEVTQIDELETFIEKKFRSRQRGDCANYRAEGNPMIHIGIQQRLFYSIKISC